MLDLLLLRRLRQFDEITRFRLINAFIFVIGFNMFMPVLLSLKGQFLVAWVITLFMIAEQLSVKTNRYFMKFSISHLYRAGIIIHCFFILSALLYFINPLYMVLLESVLSIFVIAIFGAYSMKLNNLLTSDFPLTMPEFQIIRNSTWADGILIGLAVTGILTYFFPLAVSLCCFIVYNIGYVIYMIKNWNFYINKNL